MSKKALNTKIQEYNQVLAQLRNQEGLLNKKKEIHRSMEVALNKILTDQSTDQSKNNTNFLISDELEFLYRAYRDIKIELEENEPLTSEVKSSLLI
jgi:hypothetical protein